MARQLCFVVVVGSQIAMQNSLVSATCTQKITVPGYRADTPIVTVKGLYYFALNSIPDLQLACVSAHSKQIALL